MILRLSSIATLLQIGSDESSDSELAGYLLFAGVVLVTICLLMSLRNRRRRQAIQPTPQERVEHIRQLRGMRGDLEDLMVEIEQLAKRFGAQLDAKAVQLEKLIADADEKIARLKDLPAQASAPAPAGATPKSRPLPPAVPDDPLARSVYELADQGVDPPDIAQRLNEHLGKVELIMALRSV